VHKVVKKQTRKIRQLLRTARFCHRITPVWNAKYPSAFRRAVRICRDRRFKPDEAYRLGLFGPDPDGGRGATFASKKAWTELQLSINPQSWLFLTRDKGIFYRYCMACGVPIPRLYAIFFRSTAGWSSVGVVPANRTDWEGFIESHLADEFIIKPCVGSYSRAVSLFMRAGGTLVDASGATRQASDIYDLMSSHPKYESFVIQERLRNHPELIRLSGTESLQTVRITTLIDKAGRCQIIHAHFKPIIGPYLVDTFLDGLVGNVEALVSIEDGRLKPATQITGTPAGIKTIAAHPQTGVSFDGFQLPLWPRACELVTETAPKFLPIRTIGWDVAITPDGPLVLEGNSLWDPPNQHACIEPLSSRLRGEVG
jgi:hypothetical protein